MSMYTELIFSAELKSDTPDSVIASIKYLVEGGEPGKELEFNEGIFNCGSYSFPLDKDLTSFYHNGNNWILSHRGNYRENDGNGFVDKFLTWIKPYIESGSGLKDIYAFTIYEDSHEVKTYSLEEN